MKGGFIQEDVVNVCDKIKKLANRALIKAQYDKTLGFVEILAKINYNYNFIYTDPELEEILYKISCRIMPEREKNIPIPGRFVFYDFFCAGKVLDLQYIRAMIAWNVEFLYIVERNPWNNTQKVFSEVQAYDKAEIFELDQRLSLTEKIRLAYHKITEYRPEKAFLQLAPWDVVAVTVFNALPSIERYQINLTDHAFWLGIQCLDYTIEFRSYGCTVSQEKRGISAERILLQPFYPIVCGGDFKGFPEQITNDRVVIFSGASYYKIYGSSGKYFEILKGIVEENPSAIILYAGLGDEGPLKKFIKENGFSERIFLLGFRSDINEIFSHCDIYLNTYPIGGGLMSQLAAINSKPILSYADHVNSLNDVDSVISANYEYGVKISYDDFDQFLQEARKLINDNEYRIRKGTDLKKCILTASDFNDGLYSLMMKNKNRMNIRHETIDYTNISDLYFEVDNCFLHTFLLIMGRKFKLSVLYLFPKVAFRMFLYVLMNPLLLLSVLRKK